jgi:hypothetical protein
MSVITFGKRYKGKSLAVVVLQDPDWFFWAIEQGAFDNTEACLFNEAHELAYKARNIRIPKPDPENWRVHYVCNREGKFTDLLILPAAAHSRSGIIGDRIDLSFPRQCCRYDKLGGRLMLKSFKYHFLGSERARLTKEWSERFFADESNFVRPPPLFPRKDENAHSCRLGSSEAEPSRVRQPAEEVGDDNGLEWLWQ